MNSKKFIPHNESLRSRAKVNPRKIPAELMEFDPGQIAEFINELENQRVELELRNEELQQAHQSLQAECKRFTHIRQVLSSLHDFDLLFVSEPDPSRLIEKTCQNLTENMGYPGAWIVLIDAPKELVTASVQSGLGTHFAKIQAQIDHGEFFSSFTRVLQQDWLVVEKAPDSENTEESGFIRRLAVGDHVFGVISVSVPPEIADVKEEQDLFDKLVNDLSFAFFKFMTHEELHRLNHIIETISQPVSFISRDFLYLTANTAFLEFYDTSNEQTHGCHFADLMGNDIFEAELKPILNRCFDGEVIQKEVQTTSPARGKRWLLMEYFPYYNEKGDVTGVVSHGLDVTERKLAGEALRKSEYRFREIFEGSRDGFVMIDVSGQILNANLAFCKMLGYSLEELKALKDFSQLTPTPWKKNKSGEIWYKRLLEKGYSGVFEKKYVRKNGRVFPAELQAYAVLGKGEVPEYIWAVVRDISRRKLAEETLKNQQVELEQILEAVPEALIYADAQNRITRVNSAFCRLFHYGPDEVVGKHHHILYSHPEDVEEIRQHYSNPQSPEIQTPLEIECCRKGGAVFPGEIVGTPVYDSQGKAIGFLELVREISERKRAEVEKLHLEKQFQQARKLDSIGRLAGGVAHDFNNMLGVILGHTELALKKVSPTDSLYTDLEEIHQAAERSANLTRQLLGFAREQTIAPRVLDLNEAIEGMLKILKRLIGEDIELCWQPGSGEYHVKMDPLQVNQILANLCINAQSSIKSGGRVTIETDGIIFDPNYCNKNTENIPGEFVVLTVSDNGRGIEGDALENIFEPFFPMDEEAQDTTGLCLAVVYGIVKQNGGFIIVSSERDTGSIFRIYLPVVRSEPEQIQQNLPATPVERGGETILLVEDEPVLLEMGKIMLENFGYQVLAASSPFEAIQLAKEFPREIHLLITDVVMPLMNGRDLAENIVALYSGVRCLFMSGYPANVIAHHGVLDEGVYFIQKPFSMQALSTTVRKVLDDDYPQNHGFTV